MPAFLQISLISHVVHYGQDVVARVVATRAYAWVRPFIIEAAVSVVEQAHAFAVARKARCVLLISHIRCLTFFRVNTTLACLIIESRAALIRMQFARLRIALVRVAAAWGELVLLGLAVRWLERMVRFVYLLLDHLLTTV